MGVETSLVLLISGLLLAISPKANLVKILSLLQFSSWWGERLEVISQILVIYGLIALILATASFFLHKRGQSLAEVMRRQFRLARFRAESGGLRIWLSGEKFKAWFLAALAIGAAIRIYFLSQPMRGDEAYTFLNFANRGFLALFDYPVPNNHVLNTVLIKLSTLVLGGSPAAIRMPAFLAGIAVILLTYRLARALNPHKYAGILAAMAAAVFPYLILYSTNARGYSLVTLLTVALALAGLRYADHPDRSGTGWLAVISALGMWAMPTMIFGIAGLYCWLAGVLWLEKYPLKMIVLKFTLPFGSLTALFTFILYTPVIIVSNGVAAITSNKFVESQNWTEFTSHIVTKLQSATLELLRDVPLAAATIAVLLVVAGVFLAMKVRNWRAFLLLPGLAAGALILLAVQRTTPYARLWIYTLPFLFIMAEYGFTQLTGLFLPKFQHLAVAALFILGCLLVVRLAAGNVITLYPDTSAFPEAPIAAQYLKPILVKGDRVRVTNTADWSVYYYFWYYGIPYSPEEKQSDGGNTFIIVKKSRYSLEDMTSKPVIKLLEHDDLALYQEAHP